MMFNNSFNLALIVVAIIGICGAIFTILLYKWIEKSKKSN